MKNFNELTKAELAQLSETQVLAYTDIELAKQGIVKPVDVKIDYPNYVKVQESAPEKDVVLWEVDGYKFLDLETAQNFADFVGKIQQVDTSYDYYTDSSVYYVTGSKFVRPTVQSNAFYSEAKYTAIKGILKALKESKKNKEDSTEKTLESVINYEAIDNVKYSIRNKVRCALDFFARAKTISADYLKYLTVTNDKETAINTLFTVYNVQDEELKEQVKKYIESQAVTSE